MIKNLIFGVYLLIFWQKVSKPTKATKKKKKKLILQYKFTQNTPLILQISTRSTL